MANIDDLFKQAIFKSAQIDAKLSKEMEQMKAQGKIQVTPQGTPATKPFNPNDLALLQHTSRLPMVYNHTPELKQKIVRNTEQFATSKPVSYGLLQGLNVGDTKRTLEKQTGTKIDTSQAENKMGYKVGYSAGLMGLYGMTGGVARGAVKMGVQKALPSLAKKGLARTVVSSAVADALSGIPVNTSLALSRAIEDGDFNLDAFAKEFALDTGLDVLFGGLLESAVFLKTGKKISKVADMSDLSPKEKAEFKQVLKSRLEQVNGKEKYNAFINQSEKLKKVELNPQQRRNIIRNKDIVPIVPQAVKSATKTPKKAPKTSNIKVTEDGEVFETLGKLSQEIEGSHVTKSNDLMRNSEYAFRNSPEGKRVFDETILKPFQESKLAYTQAIKSKVGDLMDKVVNGFGIKKGTRVSAAVQEFGEGFKIIKENGKLVKKAVTREDIIKEFNYTASNGKKMYENIFEADDYFRGLYDNYVRDINAILEKIYPNVEKQVNHIDNLIKKETNPAKIKSLEDRKMDILRNKRLVPRKDYYRHMQDLEGEGFFASLEAMQRGATDIDPRGIGMNTKPLTKTSSILQKRKGGEFTADAVGGFENYIKQAEYKIHFEPHIKRVRDFTENIIEHTTETKNATSFIESLKDFADELAGKAAPYDRGLARAIGEEKSRIIMGATTKIMNRMRANAVMGNIPTIFIQAFNFQNVAAYARNPADLVVGIREALKGFAGDKAVQNLLKQSPFLEERYLSRTFRQLDHKALQKAENIAVWALEALDKGVAESAFLTFYRQGIKKGLKHADAIFEADNLVRKSIAGRGIGEMPPSQRAILTKNLLPFTVEVRNALNVYKEFINKGAYGIKAKDSKLVGEAAGGLTSLFVVSFLLNKLGEVAIGREGILPDPIDVFFEELDHEEFSANRVLTKLIGEAISAHPAGQYIAGALGSGMYFSSSQMKAMFGESDPTRYGTSPMLIGTFTKPLSQAIRGNDIDVLSLAGGLLPKFGGRQMVRSIKGMQDMALIPKEHIRTSGISSETYDFPSGRSAGGNVRYAIDDNANNYIRSILLGSSSTMEGMNYFLSNKNVLSERQTKALTALGGGKQAEKFVREFPKGVEAQRKAILESSFSNEQKKALSEALINSDKKLDYGNKVDYEFSLLNEKVKQKYLKVANKGITKQVFMDAVKGADLDQSGRINKQEAYEYLERLNLTTVQKRALFDILSTAKNPY